MQHIGKYLCYVPHKGEILEKVVRSKAANMTELSNKMSYNRTTLYRHFADPNLDDAIILKYAKALKYDFRTELPSLINYSNVTQESLGEYRPVTLSEALKEVDMWKQKYIDLLEKHTELLNSIKK